MAKKRKLAAGAAAAAAASRAAPAAAAFEPVVLSDPVVDEPNPHSDDGQPQSLADAGQEEAEDGIGTEAEDVGGGDVGDADDDAGEGDAHGHSVEDEEEEDEDPAAIQEILYSFSKDQLVELIREAAASNPSLLDAVRSAADADPAQRKIFVHGLGWDATNETVKSVFDVYGEIEDLKVVSDRATGKCKGYAFILFRRAAAARRALKEPQKKIGSRSVGCQLASVGPVTAAAGGSSSSIAVPSLLAPTSAPVVSEYTQRKIFVSNVGSEIDPHKLLQFFSKYGEIEEGPLGLDRASGKPKGFALFVYKSVESAKAALEEPHKTFEGHILHCQRAIDGNKPHKQGFGGIVPGVRKDAAGFGVGSHQVPGAPGAGHLMAPSVSTLGFNQPAVNPALGQALTALLATQGAGLGLLGSLGSNGVGAQAASPGVSGGHGLQGPYGGAGVMGSYGGSAYSGYGAGQRGGRNYMGH